MVQALPTGEISVCDKFKSEVSTNNKIEGFVYTKDDKHNEELNQKTKKFQFFPVKTNSDADCLFTPCSEKLH